MRKNKLGKSTIAVFVVLSMLLTTIYAPTFAKIQQDAVVNQSSDMGTTYSNISSQPVAISSTEETQAETTVTDIVEIKKESNNNLGNNAGNNVKASKKKDRRQTEIIVKYKDESKRNTVKESVKKKLKLSKLDSGKKFKQRATELLKLDEGVNIDNVLEELRKIQM